MMILDEPSAPDGPRIAVLDIDGTLIDSVYQHAIAWSRAFRQVGLEVPAHRLHHAIGLSADQLISSVAGAKVERALGTEIRSLHGQELDRLWPTVNPLPGAESVIGDLSHAGWRVACATSGGAEDAKRALDLVDGAWELAVLVTADDDEEGKPAPDLLEAAVERAGGDPSAGQGVAIGDSPWDMAAARRAGLVPIGVLTGGFEANALLRAGAQAVLESLPEVVDRLRGPAGEGLPT